MSSLKITKQGLASSKDEDLLSHISKLSQMMPKEEFDGTLGKLIPKNQVDLLSESDQRIEEEESEDSEDEILAIKKEVSTSMLTHSIDKGGITPRDSSDDDHSSRKLKF